MNSAGAQDLYSLTPTPQKITQKTRQQLVEKARNFHHESKRLKQSDFFEHHQQFYIVSVKFLNRWKVYVGYEQANGGKSEYSKFFGSGELPVVNEDIVESNNKPNLLSIQFSGNYKHLNVILKSGLQQGKDYIFATSQMWQIINRGLKQDEYIQINRKVVETTEGKKVQLYYQRFTVVPICHQILKDIEYEKRSTLLNYTFQFSHYASVEQFTKVCKQQVSDKLPYEYTFKLDRQMKIKVWLSPEKTQKQILYNTFLQGCKANSTFSYRLYFEGQRLENEKKISDYDIFQDSILTFQYKQDRTDWCFFNKSNILVTSCSNCRAVQKLEHFCSCKSVAYCSKQCKVKDKTFHEGRCPNNAQSDEEQKQMKLTEQSRRGVTGLRNLGNTCFMNSGLQCLSHIFQLTEYFLNNKYAQDINKQNPLGTKGELSMAFAQMVKSLWYGTQSTFSPTQVKRAIGKFQPMFSGYNQHDSGELITYMLDGLHEDLNRVKIKPYVQTKDYDGRPDNLVAIEQWQSFLKRNRSQIIDLMYGQYRSVVDCPKCQNRSIQFDPFCMCSLPLINSALKKIQITYVSKHLILHKVQICFEKSNNWSMKQIGDQLKKKINKPNSNIIFYVGSYSSCELIDFKRKVNEVRGQYKYRTLYARQLEDGQDTKKGVKVILGITTIHSYYKDQSYRKSLSPYRLYYFSEEMTLKQLHQKIYSFYKDVYPIKNYQEEVVNLESQKKPFKMLAIATSRYSQCEYCQKKSCDGCQIPYTDQTLKSYVKNVDEDKIQFQFYCRKNQKQVEQKFESQPNNSDYKTGETTLNDCFKLFSEPETLAEDNAWYCPNCKDFVLAKKQMQIYKAPKILILCLKRFKRKQYSQQKYSILVDFPIQDLDLSDYVINKKLPTHEINTQIEQSFDGPLLYDLFAISNHFGSTGGGHYTAYCKNPISGEWYDFDDSSVSKVSKSSIITQSAYILFYRRKN